MAGKKKAPKAAKKDHTLRDRIKAASKIKETKLLEDSPVFEEKVMIPTTVLGLNVALSGKCDGGLLPGSLMIAGPSKHFKTLFGLLVVDSFLKKYDDGVVLFYDSEFGTPMKYFKIFGMDTSRIIHSPIDTVEGLITDIIHQVDNINKGEPLLIFIDSIGNLASKRELDDALAGKDHEDMGRRAKRLKSLFRMLTIKLILKGIPLIAINHTYKTMGTTHSTEQTGGGTGPIYNSNDIWVIGRRQIKEEGKALEGYQFVINIEKSRTIKEKSKFFLTVSFEEGIQRWSGVFDLALEAGVIGKGKQGWYTYGAENFQKKTVEFDTAFWTKVLAETGLKTFIEEKYCLSDGIIINKDEDVADDGKNDTVEFVA